MKLENIDIVMVGTTHPGNIGAAARAMHNMAISNLVLVNPECPIGEIAYARASGANLILDNRRVTESLQEALEDSALVIASSARERSLSWPQLTPESMVQKIGEVDDDTRVSLVFGREHSGLTNEELQLCHHMVVIPTNPRFSSLNVASAIQVLCYELFKRAIVENERPPKEAEAVATSRELEGYFQHLRQVMTTTEFYDSENPGFLMQKLRRLYQRFELTRSEVNILRGFLNSIEKYKNNK